MGFSYSRSTICSTEILRYANDFCKRFLSDVNNIGLLYTHSGTRVISGVFTLADTETQTETYKKLVYHCVELSVLL